MPKQRPPKYRYASMCPECKWVKISHSCGCCQTEYICTKFDNCDVEDDKVCDDFELEDS